MGDLGKNEMRIALISRCSKLFNIILSKYFYFASRSQAAPQHSSCKQACLALHSVCTDIESHSCTASACPALSHIARYAPECRTSSYGTITQFKCKNNYEHLLNAIQTDTNSYKKTGRGFLSVFLYICNIGVTLSPSATSRHHALQRERLRRHVRNLSGLLSEQTKVDAAVGAVFKKVGTVGKIVGLAMFQHKKGAFLYQS